MISNSSILSISHKSLFGLFLLFFFAFSTDSVSGQGRTVSEVSPKGGPIIVRAPTSSALPGSNFSIYLTADDTTGQNVTGFEFRIVFDPAVISFSDCVTAGTIFAGSGGSATCNLFPGPPFNRISGFVSRQAAVSGPGSILRLDFQVVGALGSVSPLNFEFFFFNEGTPASTTVNGSVTIALTTEANASVAGRVTRPDGGGIGRTRVRLMNTEGREWTAMTNGFGFFKLEGVPVGQTYVLSASSKQHTFQSVALTVNDDLSDIVILSEN